ncbi:MAG TPA: YhgE/Pip domain-containing protein [Lachnospiraceae bacterium]|nr:YhgE/Pip domain-containing protein [Lachnospiraceae bacterium]
MKNIWKIFTGDLKKLVKQPFALVIIIGLCVIPSLYAWFNIFANWDPYANTGGIPVAVVSLDKDYTRKDGSVVNMGESVLESLHSNTSVKWIFLDTEEEAQEGVEAGKYYAAIVITDKFTYSMYNVFSDDFENPSLIYYQNQKSNAIATKITDTVAGTLQNTINETFIKVAATTIFEEGNSVSDQMQGDSYVEEFCADLEELNDNLKEYSTMIDTFRAGNDRLEAAITHVNYEIPVMQKKLDATTASLNQSSQNLSSTRDTLSNFSTNVDTSMSTIQTSLEDMKKILDQSKLADDTAQMTKDLNKVARDTNTLNGQVNNLLAALIEQRVQGSVSGGDASTGSGSGNTAATDAAIEALKAMQKELDMMNTVIGSVLESTDEQAAEKAKVNVNNAMNNLKNVIDSCENSVSNMQGIYKNNLVPQMQKVLTNMSDSLNQVTTLVNTLSNTVQNIGVVMEGVGDAIDGTSESLGQIQGVVDGISQKLTDLTEQLEGASEEEMMDILVRFLGGDPDSLGAYFASPVTMETIAMYPVATYGSAMTPFYSTLAIWVGSTILVALVKVKASPKNLKNVQSYQLYFGRYLLFLLLAQIQAAIIVAGDLWLLNVNIVEPGLFFLAASFTATAFSLLIYSLTLAFGDVGKAVCVIVMVLQIAGSSGTFPIELLPDIYQKIYIFFPFPYAITAMREALAGMYGTAYMAALAKLILFMLEGLLIGLVIRIPFVKLNHFVEERMEDTELM